MLDLKVYEPSRQLAPNSDPLVIKDATDTKPHYHGEVLHEAVYQFRYVVHRQATGFFTPVTFDVLFKWVETAPDDLSVTNYLNLIAEPFIEGALFMNHTSTFIVDMLKGQEAGFNRKTVVEDLRNGLQGTSKLWYSDWLVPPPTKQGQRIVVYDMDQTGSMLDPKNVVTNIATWGQIPFPRFKVENIYYAAIIAGYTSKTV